MTPELMARACVFLNPDESVALARAATGSPPTLVLVMVDEDGLVVAARDELPSSDQLREAFSTLSKLVQPRGAAAAVVVTPPLLVTRSAWDGVSNVLREADIELLDWLMDDGEHTASLARDVGVSPPWTAS